MKKFNTIKKLAAAGVSAALLFSLAACGNSNSGNGDTAEIPAIGLLQYGEHASLDNCREGFVQGLTEAGLTEGVDYTLDYQNASFDNSLNTQIAGTFAANGVDMMVGVATPSAVACYAAAEEKDIPVIFVAVNDPEQAELNAGNVTGSSDALPVDAQLALIRALQPEATTIGIIYTTSEPNSVSTIAQYEERAPEYGFTIEAVGVAAQNEVTQATDTLIGRGVDCFSNLTDNNVVGVLAAILEKTNEAGIPVYGSEIEQVKIGCVASAGIDYLELGAMTGALAAQVLKGEAVCDDLPYITVTDYSTYTNAAALSEMGLTLTEDVAARAVEVGTEA